MRKMRSYLYLATAILTLVIPAFLSFAAPLPGGTLDPLSIPKYLIPLVIPPVMNDTGVADNYHIAVRQFKQQILPGGIWDTVADPNHRYANFPATTIWSYGPNADPLPDSSAPGAI